LLSFTVIVVFIRYMINGNCVVQIIFMVSTFFSLKPTLFHQSTNVDQTHLTTPTSSAEKHLIEFNLTTRLPVNS